MCELGTSPLGECEVWVQSSLTPKASCFLQRALGLGAGEGAYPPNPEFAFGGLSHGLALPFSFLGQHVLALGCSLIYPFMLHP